MKSPKYQIGQKVQIENLCQITINHIKKHESIVELDGEKTKVTYYSYSEDGTGYYPESSINIEGNKCH